MQIQSLRIKSYRSWKIDDRVYSDTAKKKFKLLQDFEALMDSGSNESVILDVLGISRSTFYKIKAQHDKHGLAGLEPKSKRPNNVRKPGWDKGLESFVLKLRKQEPTWGKHKIHRLMIRDHGMAVSLSAVGRIISKLIATNKVKSAYFAANKHKPKRRRVFKKHATRWKHGMKGSNPGEMLQIDHMSVYSNSACVKHFKAVCPCLSLWYVRFIIMPAAKQQPSF